MTQQGLRSRPSRLIILSVACLVLYLCAGGPRAAAQYKNIVESCGAPGHDACSTLPSCQSPSSLIDDAYTGKILCDVPGSARLGQGGPSSLPDLLPQYESGMVTPGDTIFTSTDLHFGKPSVSDQDHVNHSLMMKQFAKSGTFWPAGVGFDHEAIHTPAAIVTTGDDTHYGQESELGDFRLLFEQGWVNESTPVPVMSGLGNHDAYGSCEFDNCAKRMFDYEAGHIQGGVQDFDPDSHNYSWDWNGIHYVQLNQWAGYTDEGSDLHGNQTTHPSGLNWLVNDLADRVGKSHRPIIIFQHFGYDCFSLESDGSNANTNAAPNLHCGGTKSSPWWVQNERSSFSSAIKGYNVVAMFSGHQHTTAMYDDNEFGDELDDFVGGTGGEDPCLNGNMQNTPCGGRGHFFVTRIKGNYLDVASVEWDSDPSGNITSPPHFTNLAPTYTDGKPGQGPSFTEGQNGCRKLINMRIVEVGTGSATVAASGSPFQIGNTGPAVGGLFAARIQGLDGTDVTNVTNKHFVDRCVQGANAYIWANNGNALTLNSGAKLAFTAQYAGSPSQTLTASIVHINQSHGSSPAVVSLSGSIRKIPSAGTVTIFGTPGVAFAVSTTANLFSGGTSKWLTVSPLLGVFDIYGRATLTYTPQTAVLKNDADLFEDANISVATPTVPSDAIDIPVTLQWRLPSSISLLNRPPTQIASGKTFDLSVQLNYKQYCDSAAICQAATGSMSIYDVTFPAAPVQVAGPCPINSSADQYPCSPSGNFPANDHVLFSNVLLIPLNQPHVLQVTYTGDSYQSESSSSTFTVDVGSPSVQLSSTPSALSIVFSGVKYQTPAAIPNLAFGSTHTVQALTPQLQPGYRFLFDHWADDNSTTATRQFTVDLNSNPLPAVFNTQVQVNLAANSASNGTITSTTNPPDFFYPSGSVETIQATPAKGYAFASFSGLFKSTTNPMTVTIAKPGTITANFTKAPHSIAVTAGSGQSGVYGSNLPSGLVVLVKDSTGNPIVGTPVTFSATGMRLSSTTAVTNAAGLAAVTATVTGVGSLSARATVPEISTPAVFTGTGTKATLTVTATSASAPYGQAIPALTYSISGFVNGESTANISGVPTETTTAKRGSVRGQYPISLAQGTLSSADYNFAFVGGTFTVSIGQVTFTLRPSANPSIAFTVVDFAVSVTAIGSGASPTGSVNYTVDSTGGGRLTLNSSGRSSFNYSFTKFGIHPVVGTYLGDSNYGPATVTVNENIIF